MSTLISRWKLRSGASPELLAELPRLAEKVKAAEPDTWAYSVHLEAPFPLNAEGDVPSKPPEPIPPEQQTEVIFFEIYKDACAFRAHLEGAPFSSFVRKYRHCFYADPSDPKRPYSVTTVLERESAYFRHEANGES